MQGYEGVEVARTASRVRLVGVKVMVDMEMIQGRTPLISNVSESSAIPGWQTPAAGAPDYGWASIQDYSGIWRGIFRIPLQIIFRYGKHGALSHWALSPFVDRSRSSSTAVLLGDHGFTRALSGMGTTIRRVQRPIVGKRLVSSCQFCGDRYSSVCQWGDIE